MKNSRGSLIRPHPLPESASRPVVTPLQPSVVYASDSPNELDAQYEGRVQGYTYAREGHPNATVLARKIDALEGATDGLIVGSGMAAVTAVLMGVLKAGDHVLGGDQLYGRSLRLMGQDLPRLGIATSLADPTDAAAFERALRPDTRMVLVELVSNPTLRVADIPAIAALCRERGILLAVDSTFSTPRAFRPFEHAPDDPSDGCASCGPYGGTRHDVPGIRALCHASRASGGHEQLHRFGWEPDRQRL